MADQFGGPGIGDALSQALSALGRFQGQQADAEPPAGAGEAADGMITVRAVPPGQIEDLRLDPRLMRMPSEALAEQMTIAVNAALGDLREKANAAAGPVDLGTLGDELKQIQHNAERQFSAFTNAMVEAQERLAQRAGGQ